jgi:energy-coupling factor transport system ATP-binding protein
MSIIINKLSYTYDLGLSFEKKALEDVSLTIHEGQIAGIIGHTGSGKSTLIQHMNGLIKTNEKGKVLVDQEDLFDLRKDTHTVCQKVGMVFQYPEMQLFEETVEKDVGFGPKNLGLNEKAIKERVVEALEMVDLDYDKIHLRQPFFLSGGEKRRVAIAGILAMKPKYLILDEPTAGLDPYTREQLLDEIQTINKEKKITIIMVSHDMDEVSRLTDILFVMHKSKIALSGATRDVFAQFEKIRELGLMVPEITEVLLGLSRCKPDLDYTLFDLDLAVKEILKCSNRYGN